MVEEGKICRIVVKGLSRFGRMVKNYEKEQKELVAEVAESEQTLQKAKQQVVDFRLLLRTLREMTDIKELAPTLVNSLMKRIEVHNNDKSGSHCYVKADIYFTGAGMIDIHTEEEIFAMMVEIQKNTENLVCSVKGKRCNTILGLHRILYKLLHYEAVQK